MGGETKGIGLASGALGTILATCLFQGMFYVDTPSSLMLVSVWFVLAAGVCVKFVVRGLPSSAFFVRNTGRGMFRLLLGPFLLAALYAVHLLLSPLSIQATIEAWLSWTFYGVLGVAFYTVSNDEQGQKWLRACWGTVGGLLAFSALATVYGLLPLPGAIFRTDDPEIAASGARLGGLLQYPNAFGAVMAAFALERLVALARYSPADLEGTGKWRVYRAGAAVLLFGLCLLLSESRGAYAAGLVGWTAGLWLLRGPERRRYLLHSGVLVAACAVLARQLAAAQLAPAPLPGMLSLAAVMAAALLLAERACRVSAGHGPRLARAARLRRPMARLRGGAAVLAAAALLPATLLAGTGSLGRWLRPGTGYARAALYRAAAELLREAPWLGRGGDTWRQAFHRIQQGPYVGSEVHSGYLDIALDLGLIGLAVLLLWLGYIVMRMYRMRSAMLPPTIVLLLHSAVDFDMSYGLIWLLLLWLAVAAVGVGGMAEVYGELPLNAERDVLSTSGHTAHTPALPRTPRFVLACAAALLLAAGAVGFRQAESLKYYRKAVSAASISDTALQAPTVQATIWLERSLAYSPYRASARLALAALSAPADAAPQLRVGLVYDPAHPGLWLALGEALAQQGDPAAIPALQRALELDRFDRTRQTAALRSIVLLAQHLQSQGRLREAQVAVATGEAVFNRYKELVKQVAFTDRRNDRQFHMTAEAEALDDTLKRIRKASQLRLTLSYD